MSLLSAQGGVQDFSVVFHDSLGEVVAVEQTDAVGMASHDVPADAMVTLVVPNFANLIGGGSNYGLFTVVGVQSDDQLTIGNDIDPWATLGATEIAFDGSVSGATYYVVSVGCDQTGSSDPGQPLVIELGEACFKNASSFDVVGYALDSEDNILAYATANNVPIDSGGTAFVDLPPWQTDPRDVSLSLSNPQWSAGHAGVQLSTVAGGVPFFAGSSSDNLSVDGPTLFDLQIPSDFASGLEYLVSVYHKLSALKLGGGQPDSVSYLYQRRGDIPTAINHDLSAEMLPVITTAWIDTETPARPSLVITVDGDLSDADGGYALLDWQDGTGSYFQWWIMFPPGQTSIQVPALPDFLSNYRPSPDAVFNLPQVAVFDADFVADYTDARNERGFNFILDTYSMPRTDQWVLRFSSGPGGFLQQ